MEAILRLEKVSKAFGTQQVLEAFDLSVEEGEFVTLLGPSGCGKTTVLNLVAGFLRPDSGTIYLRGKPVERCDHPEETTRDGLSDVGPLSPHECLR